MSRIVEVETLNGTEFVNLDHVHRFVVGVDGSLELRFGKAETLLLTGDSAQRVLQWVRKQAQTFAQESLTTTEVPPTVAATAVRQPEQAKRRIQLMSFTPNTYLSLDRTAETDVPTLNAAALSTTPPSPSPTINRNGWLP